MTDQQHWGEEPSCFLYSEIPPAPSSSKKYLEILIYYGPEQSQEVNNVKHQCETPTDPQGSILLCQKRLSL